MIAYKLSPQRPSLLSRLRIYVSFLALIFAGPIVIGLPQDLFFLQEFATRLGVLLFILGLWELLLRFIVKFILAPGLSRGKARKAFVFFVTFFLSAAILYFAGHLEDKVTHTFLAIVLISLGIRALAQGLEIAEYQKLSFAALMIYFFAISVLSCAITAAAWHWQFLFVALALQAGLHSDFYLKQFESTLTQLEPNAGQSVLFWSRLHSLALIFAPVSIALLQYLGFFPTSYLICLLALALMLRAAEISAKIEKKIFTTLPETLSAFKRIRIFSELSSIAFVICFILAAYIQL